MRCHVEVRVYVKHQIKRSKFELILFLWSLIEDVVASPCINEIENPRNNFITVIHPHGLQDSSNNRDLLPVPSFIFHTL